MGDFGNLQVAVEERIRHAHQLALAIAPDLELLLAFKNAQNVALSPATRYLRGYQRSTSRRLSSGDFTLQRTIGWIFIQIMLRKEEGDQEVTEIADAMRPAFVTGGQLDRLEFEEAAELLQGRLDGSHWLALVQFPFTRNVRMPTAA